MKLELKTTAFKDGTIVSELLGPQDDMIKERVRFILDTREEQTRKALIDLGWTPPDAFSNMLDSLAKFLWSVDYPQGGSVYKTFEDTPFHDREAYRVAARSLLKGNQNDKRNL